jgi:hypothetical protein
MATIEINSSEDDEHMKNNIAIVQRQTNYTVVQAREKLLEKDGNYVHVIEEFMGINKKETKKNPSLQQEIYKQIRVRMDDSIKNYNKKQEEKLGKEIDSYIQTGEKSNL